MTHSRRAALEKLIRLQASPRDLVDQIKQLPWDAEVELIELRVDDVIAVLKRHLSGELDRQDLETWADLIEGREDIGMEASHADRLKAVIYELANPTIMGDLTSQRVHELADTLRE